MDDNKPQNKVQNLASFHDDDGLDEIEDLEDMVGDDKGFHFHGGPQSKLNFNNPEPVSAPKRQSMGSLDIK